MINYTSQVSNKKNQKQPTRDDMKKERERIRGILVDQKLEKKLEHKKDEIKKKKENAQEEETEKERMARDKIIQEKKIAKRSTKKT